MINLAEHQNMGQTVESFQNRDSVLEEYIPYVRRIVGRMAIHLPNSVETEDLVHAGIIGLIDAIDRFDPHRGNKFITYALYRIRGAVLSELRARDYLSRSFRKKIREMDTVYSSLEKKLGREPDDDEVASELGIELDKLYELKKLSSLSFISFESMGYSTKEEKDRFTSILHTDVMDASRLAGLKELHEALADAIDSLPEKEKIVVSLYYHEELTMKEIGAVLGITESRVSQIHSRSVLRLRDKLRKKGLVDD